MTGVDKTLDTLTETAIDAGLVWLGFAVLTIAVILLGKLVWKLILDRITETKKRLESGHKEFQLGRDERAALLADQKDIRGNFMSHGDCQKNHEKHLIAHRDWEDRWEKRFAEMETRQIESDKKLASLIGEVRSGFKTLTELLSKVVKLDNAKT